jgi:hypothetical protein
MGTLLPRLSTTIVSVVAGVHICDLPFCLDSLDVSNGFSITGVEDMSIGSCTLVSGFLIFMSLLRCRWPEDEPAFNTAIIVIVAGEASSG